MGIVKYPGDIRPYDFQRPHQLSRMQLDAVTLVTESYIRVAANFLSTYLRTPVQIQHVRTEQLPFDTYLEQIETPSVLVVFSQAPLPGNALWQCPPSIALAMIDRALGGPGVGGHAMRELTEIERTIFRRMADRLLQLLSQHWAAMLATEPKVEAIEHNPAFTQVAGEGDLVMIMHHQITLDGTRGEWVWVWPYSGIQPFTEAVSRHGRSGRDDGIESVIPRPDDMRRHVEQAPVTARVVMGRTHLSLGEFSQLSAGDVVVVDTRVDQALKMVVSQREKYQVVPGRRHGHLAVRVVGWNADAASTASLADEKKDGTSRD